MISKNCLLFLVFLYNQNKILNSLFSGPDKPSENIESCGISSWKYAFILILLPALVLLSYPASLFIVFPLYNMVLFAVKNKNSKIVKYIVIYTASSLFFLSILYFFDVRLPSLSSEMKVVTKGFSDYFISFHSAGDFLKTLGEGTNNLFSRWFAERPRVLRKIAIFFVSFGLIEMFYGFFSQIKREKYFTKSVETIALILYLELFILGVLRRYPFTVPRTALFFCPFVIVLTIKGIMNICKINKYISYVIFSSYMVFLLYLTVSFARIIFAGHFGAVPVL